MKAITHIFNPGQYFIDFEKFIRSEGLSKEHTFILIGSWHKISLARKLARGLNIFFKLLTCKNIFLHQMNSPRMVLTLILISYFKPITWVTWGGDLDFMKHPPASLKYRIIQNLYHLFIRRLTGVAAQMPGDLADVEFIKWPSNIKRSVVIYPLPWKAPHTEIAHSKVELPLYKVLIGNSAGETNNHLEIIDRCASQFGKNLDMQYIFPFNYGGTTQYREEVMKYANLMLGNNCDFIVNKLLPMEYYALLQKISLTIYAHDRQQGLGTLYPLIFFGSKIVIKRNASSYQYFNKKIRGLMPFEESFNVNFDPLSNSNLKHNQGFVKEELSPANIRKSWGF